MKREITNIFNKFFNSLVFVNRMIQILCPFVKCVIGTVTGEYFKRIPSGILRRYFTLIASSKVHVDAHKVETVPLITLKTEITLNPYL